MKKNIYFKFTLEFNAIKHNLYLNEIPNKSDS